MLFGNGSRGDAQPLVALGAGLQRAGFAVRVGINPNFVALVQSFGLEAFACGVDSERFVVHDEEFRKTMTTGRILSAIKSMAAENKAVFGENLAQKVREIDGWKPDLILAHVLDLHEVSAIAASRNIPCMWAGLQCLGPSRNLRSLLGEPDWVPHKAAGYLALYLLWLGDCDGKNKEILRQAPEVVPYLNLTRKQFFRNLLEPYTPCLFGVSPSLFFADDDYTAMLKERAHFTGNWVIGKEDQEAKLQRQDPQFGGDARPVLEAFLAKGPPVYLGWGSMVPVSEQHMACLAVRALMRARLRGIVLGGWARLRPEHLEGQPDTPAMQEYAKDNVLFVDSAPHEWLFPRCSVIVHHGGAGTSAAAMRSGVPSVVTPCAFDQTDNAKIIADRGAGVAMRQFSKVTPADLAATITRCATDAGIIGAARALGEALRKEDGVASAVRVVDDFLADEVDTGKWRANHAQRVAEMQALGSFRFGLGCCMGGFGALGRSAYKKLPPSTE